MVIVSMLEDDKSVVFKNLYTERKLYDIYMSANLAMTKKVDFDKFIDEGVPKLVELGLKKESEMLTGLFTRVIDGFEMPKEMLDTDGVEELVLFDIDALRRIMEKVLTTEAAQKAINPYKFIVVPFGEPENPDQTEEELEKEQK